MMLDKLFRPDRFLREDKGLLPLVGRGGVIEPLRSERAAQFEPIAKCIRNFSSGFSVEPGISMGCLLALPPEKFSPCN
jgi:hypothetical protein